MKPTSTPPIGETALRASRSISSALQRHWLKMALLGTAVYMAHHRDMDINLQLNGATAAAVQAVPQKQQPQARAMALRSAVAEPRPMNTSMARSSKSEAAKQPKKSSPPKRVNVSNLSNTYSNLTAANKGEKRAESKAVRRAKRRRQQQYVQRFAKVAQMEMEKYGIPASITLAQGLLESNVGASKLATHNNNHFGIKCFSRSCRPGHCSNFTDDSHKDFFRKYKSAWESYRAHSLLLKRSDRYQPLFELPSSNYKAWAKGLKKAGYATDAAYADKIIHLIEDLDLHRFDR